MNKIKSDIEIARSAKIKPIGDVLRKFNVPDDPFSFSPMGRHIAKLNFEYINKLKEKLSKEIVGVGIRVVTLKNKEHMIADTFRGHASSKIVKSRDIILSINGSNIKGLSNDEAREFIIGNIVGSLVNLKIRRGEEIIDVQLKRERYKPEDVI